MTRGRPPKIETSRGSVIFSFEASRRRGSLRGPLSAPRGRPSRSDDLRLAHRTRRSRRDRRGPGVWRQPPNPGLRRTERSSTRPRRRGDVIWRSRRWAASCCASRRRGPDPRRYRGIGTGTLRSSRAKTRRAPPGASARPPHLSFSPFFLRYCEPRVPNPAEPRPPSPRSTRQVGGDYEFIMGLMHDEFFHSAKEKTARCADAAERALANPDAHEKRSMKIIAVEAHAMKGSALTLCAKAVGRAVRASGARRQRPVPGSEPHRRGRPAPVGPGHRRQARPALCSRRRDRTRRLVPVGRSRGEVLGRQGARAAHREPRRGRLRRVPGGAGRRRRRIGSLRRRGAKRGRSRRRDYRRRRRRLRLCAGGGPLVPAEDAPTAERSASTSSRSSRSRGTRGRCSARPCRTSRRVFRRSSAIWNDRERWTASSTRRFDRAPRRSSAKGRGDRQEARRAGRRVARRRRGQGQGQAVVDGDVALGGGLWLARSGNPCDFIRLVRNLGEITSSRSACSEGSSTRWTRSAGGSGIGETTAGTISSCHPTQRAAAGRLGDGGVLSSQNLGDALAALTRLCSTHRGGDALRRCVERVEDAGFELRSFSEGLARAQMATTGSASHTPRESRRARIVSRVSRDDDETCAEWKRHTRRRTRLRRSLLTPKETSRSRGDPHARLA